MSIDTVFIYDLKLQTLIGVLPYERLKKQTLWLDIELESNFSQAQQSDDVRHTLNYAAIADFIIEFAEQAQYKLLERFAHELCQALFEFCSANVIHLTLRKSGAIAHTQNLGIKITRTRPIRQPSFEPMPPTAHAQPTQSAPLSQNSKNTTADNKES